MKLKNKTELRKIIHDSVGNTGSLDYIWVHNDGEWSIQNCNTSPQDQSEWNRYSMYEYAEYEDQHDTQAYRCRNNAITKLFSHIDCR